MTDDSPAEQEKREARRKVTQKRAKEREKVYGKWQRNWEKGQQYHIRETLDADGDSLWSVTGPNVKYASHSIDGVRSFLEKEGVEYRCARFTFYVWAGAPEPHDGDA